MRPLVDRKKKSLRLGPVTFYWPKWRHVSEDPKTISILTLFRSKWVDCDFRQMWHEADPATEPRHTHGVGMWRLCLLGGYDDLMEDGSIRKIRPGRVNHLRHDEAHEQIRLLRTPTYSFGFNLRYRGLSRPAFLLDDGRKIPMEDFHATIAQGSERNASYKEATHQTEGNLV